MTRDVRHWWGDGGDDDAGTGAPHRPPAGKVSLTQRIPAVQRKTAPEVRPAQSHPSTKSFEFVQAYGHDEAPSSGVSFPDEHPMAWLASEADQACRAAFDFDFATVQRAAPTASSIDSDVVQAAAARGLEAPAAPLPHFDRIQASFGKHDVSHVQAHVGGAAAEATASMGATAYATGDHVAFAGAPDLHTAAHEAAHIVQQKSGVQLKGGVGEVGDAYELHADAVADKVVAGESAEALLDEMAGYSQDVRPARPNAVQRKPLGQPGGKSDDSKPEGDEPELSKPRNADWHVFAASGKPFLIADRGGKHGFWAVRRWVEADPGITKVIDPRSGATALSAPSRAREILSAMGTANLEFAVQNLTFQFREHAQVEFFAVGAEAAHAVGLPPGRESLVERDVNDGLKITVALDDPSIPPGTAHTLTAGELQRTFDGAGAFTGLAVDAQGAAFLKEKWTGPGSLHTGNGVVSFPLNRGFCRTLFGMEAYDRWAGEQKAPRKRSTDASAPKLELENFYQQPIPGELTHHADFIESGEAVRFEVVVDWPGHFPDPDEFDAPPMVTPSKFGNVALLQCTWRFERVPGFMGKLMRRAAAGARSPRPDGAAPTQNAPASPTAGAAGQAPTSGGAAQLGAAASRTTDTAEVFHRFTLEPGESTATYRVTCHARFDEYFEPATFTRDVMVMASPAVMAKLQSEAFADLGAPGIDRSMGAWTGDARPDFVGSPAAGEAGAIADPMAANREAQRERLEVLGEYLRNSDEMRDRSSSAEAIAAIDAELARQRRTEDLLAKDHARGWQPFQIRGTYLSRTEGLPSGPLDLHGTVRVEARYHRYPGDGPSTVQRIRDDKYVVQLRDLSRRFEQNDFTFEGEADSFDDALKAAFDELAVAYPKGLVSIEAEQIRGEALRQTNGSPGPEASLGPSTGKVIGFQRSTETTWKKVKETVWDPVAQTAVNLGAIALMTLVPSSAPIVAPALIAYNTIPTVDNVRLQMERGTLSLGTFAMATGEIALNLLPLVSRAKPLTAGWFMVETANWGGQVALMAGTAIDMAKMLQAKQVSALAEEYQAFLELKKRSLPSDPSLAAAEDEIRRKAEAVNGEVYRQFDGLVSSNLVQMAAGSVIHNSSHHVRAAILEHLNSVPRARVATPPPATATGDGASPPSVPVDDPPTKTRDSASPSETTRAGRRKDVVTDGDEHAETADDTAHRLDDDGDAAVPADGAAAADPAVSALTWDGRRFVAEPSMLSAHRDKWIGSRPRDKVSEVSYDARTNTMFFEVRSGKSRFRVEADLPPRIVDAADLLSLENRIIGKPLKKESVGLEILREVNAGNLAALRKLGVDVPRGVTLPAGTEFGLGRTPDGKYVLVRGQHSGVTWGQVPGVTPLAHTHPSNPGNDLAPLTGSDRVALSTLFSASDVPMAAREVILPSPSDVRIMTRLGIDGHRVLTPFIVRDGHVMKAEPGDQSPRLEWVIRKPREVGRTPDGHVVFEWTLVGEVNGKPAIPPKNVWSTEPPGVEAAKPGARISDYGSHYLTKPETKRAALDRSGGRAGDSTTRASTTGGADDAPDPVELLGEVSKLTGVPSSKISIEAHAQIADVSVRVAGDGLEVRFKTGVSQEAIAAAVQRHVDLVAAHGVDAARWAGETLDGDGANRLLGSMNPTALAGLRDVSAADALESIDVFGSSLIEASVPPMTGRLFSIERRALGRTVAKGVAQGKLKPGKEHHLLAHATNLEAMEGAPRSPLSDESLMVDNNIIVAIKELMDNTPWRKLEEQKQARINHLRGMARPPLPPLTADPPGRDMESIIGRGHDLRAANSILGEGAPMAGLERSGFVLTVDRDSPQYTKVLDELAHGPLPIGGPSGISDRAMVVDAVFAAGSTQPRLMSGDRKIVERLYVRFGPGKTQPIKQQGKPLWKAIKMKHGPSFDIDIPDGTGKTRRITIISVVS